MFLLRRCAPHIPMTELLRIHPDARLDAVRRQMGQLHRTRIVLEIPEGWPGVANAARMRLLQRQALLQESPLAVISRDAMTVRAAQTVGVPVFARAEDALRKEWHFDAALPQVDLRHPAAGLPEPPPWRKLGLERLALPTQHKARQQRIRMEARARRTPPVRLAWAGYAIMGLLIVLLLAVFGLYVLPAATVTVRPGTQQISVVTQVTADPDLTESELQNNRIKGRLIETIVEDVGIAATSGALQKPTIKSTGEVQFSNLGTAPVRVPAGTIVSTSTGTPVSFRTTTDVEIPGGVGQRAGTGVEALEPGIEGNVRANTITNIDGPMRFRARVSNANGTGGGGSEMVRAVTQEDKDKLLAEALARVEGNALAALQAEVHPGEWLPAESVQSFVVAQAFDQYNDDEADQLTLTLRLLVQGVAVNEAEARDVLQAAVQEEIPTDGKLVANSLVAQRMPGAEAVERGVVFTVTVNADYVIPVDPVEVRATIAGKSEAEATRLLQERWLLSAAPEFYRDPEWVGALPALPSRIQVRVEYDEPTALP